MTKQEWIIEIIAEGVAGAINRFKEEKPYTLHQIATDTARAVAGRLHTEDVVIKVDRELPTWFVDAIDQANKLGKLPVGSGRYVNLLKAGCVAIEPLV